MRAIAILLGVLAVSATGCSKSTRNLTGPPADSRGTPLGAAGTFEAESRMLWSPATNEIVGTAAFTSATPGALIGMHALTGQPRVLDAETSLDPVTGAAGTPLYYLAIVTGPADGDSTALRRVALTGGSPQRVDACPQFCFYRAQVSADGAWLAWASASFLDFDSLVIERTTTGTRTRIEPGAPMLWSPDASQLLFRSSVGVLALTLHDRDSGTNTPFDLGLPAGAAPAGLRWDASGVHALYLVDSKALWVRHVTAGAAELLYSPGDTLLAFSTAWSPDGGHVALWSDAVSGGGQSIRRSLHVVDVAARSGKAVAVGTLPTPIGVPPPPRPSGIAFSPDSRTVAYLYADELFTSSVPGAGAGRSAAFGPAPVSLAGGEAFSPAAMSAGRASLERRIGRSRATPATPAR